VDEALFLADRIALMTNGPEARLGALLTVPFPRPRNRRDVVAHPDYYVMREKVMAFLEDHAQAPALPRQTPSAQAPTGGTLSWSASELSRG